MAYTPAKPSPRPADALDALWSHQIFTLAAQRPLVPDEVEVYLAIKQKIAAFGSSPQKPVVEKKWPTSGAFDL